MKSQKNIYKRWFLIVTFGEFIGFIIPSFVGVISVLFHFPQFVQTPIMILAGAGEGFLLGYFQGKVLAEIIPRFEKKDWIGATIMGAFTAWSIGMIPSTFYVFIEHIPSFIVISLGSIFAITLLFSLPYFQYRVMKRYTKRADQWIWLNLIAWFCGLTILFICMYIAPEGFLLTLLFSILGGLGMASVMAAITGLYVTKIKLLSSL